VPSDHVDPTSDAILAVVVRLIETDGYDGVSLRIVASDAHVSLSTIYKLFPTRDDLLLAAVSRWREINMVVPLATQAPTVTSTDALMQVFRQMLDPWIREPQFLAAFLRARLAPGGRILEDDGRELLRPYFRSALGDMDDATAVETLAILDDVVFAALSRVANGEITFDDVLDRIERAVNRLVPDAG